MILSTGKEIYCNLDIIGINDDLDVYEGYDMEIDCEGGSDTLGSNSLTNDERRELASIMIKRWEAYRAWAFEEKLKQDKENEV